VRSLAREACDDLVGIHVRRRARARLKDVDRELVVVLAVGDLARGLLDTRGGAFGKQPELAVDCRGSALQAREPAHDVDGDRLAGDREVRDCLVGLGAPQVRVLAHVTNPR
jgi:hypothetical protein